jgi:hypothetical protein
LLCSGQARLYHTGTTPIERPNPAGDSITSFLAEIGADLTKGVDFVIRSGYGDLAANTRTIGPRVAWNVEQPSMEAEPDDTFRYDPDGEETHSMSCFFGDNHKLGEKFDLMSAFAILAQGLRRLLNDSGKAYVSHFDCFHWHGTRPSILTKVDAGSSFPAVESAATLEYAVHLREVCASAELGEKEVFYILANVSNAAIFGEERVGQMKSTISLRPDGLQPEEINHLDLYKAGLAPPLANETEVEANLRTLGQLTRLCKGGKIKTGSGSFNNHTWFSMYRNLLKQRTQEQLALMAAIVKKDNSRTTQGGLTATEKASITIPIFDDKCLVTRQVSTTV